MPGAVVATECPTCGAPLDFDHGRTTVRCDHCGSSLLVTGRKRVLAYYVPPAITAGPAMSRVKLALGAAAPRTRIGDVRLHLVPYYHLTGHEFRWEEAESSERPEPGRRAVDAGAAGLGAIGQPASDDPLLATLAWAGSAVARVLGLEVDASSAPAVAATRAFAGPGSGAPARSRRLAPPEFHDRYIDRSFLATDLPGFAVQSLGVRASVVRLALFEAKAVEALGRPARVDVAVEAALAFGMEAIDAETLLSRTVIDRTLSLVYFPFWRVPHEGPAGSHTAIVDAVGDSVVTLEAAPPLLERLDRPADGTAEVVGFRPLACPNCGWDLPPRAEDVVFCCRRCGRAWQVRGREFEAVPAAVAEAPRPPSTGARSAAAATYLPCWVLDARVGDAGTRLYAPAFRFQRLKYLSDLGERLTRTQPSWAVESGETPLVHGCRYDVEDAMLLARFVRAGLRAERGERDAFAQERLEVTAATLVWFPFARAQHELVDPFTGLALPENLLV